jgi:hypothetical protein
MPRSCLSLTSLALTPQAVPPKACSHRPRTPCRLAPRRLHGCPPTQPLSSASYSRAARGVTMSARPVRTAAAASELPSVSVSVDQLRSAIWRALKQQKHSDADAAALLDVRVHPRCCCCASASHWRRLWRTQVILYAQLRDNSQGVIKVTTGASARDPDARELVVEHETKLSGAYRTAAQECNAGASALRLTHRATHVHPLCLLQRGWTDDSPPARSSCCARRTWRLTRRLRTASESWALTALPPPQWPWASLRARCAHT